MTQKWQCACVMQNYTIQMISVVVCTTRYYCLTLLASRFRRIQVASFFILTFLTTEHGALAIRKFRTVGHKWHHWCKDWSPFGFGGQSDFDLGMSILLLFTLSLPTYKHAVSIEHNFNSRTCKYGGHSEHQFFWGTVSESDFRLS